MRAAWVTRCLGSNVTLRGAGADQTILYFYGTPAVD